jgi:phosphoribosylaminoimidazolecarboxamide formyltransferase/IMP cyclohydrolase
LAHVTPVRRALISVSDTAGVEEFAKRLARAGVELISTGGTARLLRAADIPTRDVSDVTGFPEIMDGRVKTLHPKIHGGLLGARDKKEHAAAMAAHGIAPIDLLAVNLYPFEAALSRGAPFGECVENIDIGGPAMIRAAAKNHAHVAVVVDPTDYGRAADEIETKGGLGAELRRTLAARAYSLTASYDAAISAWLAREAGEEFPPAIAFGGRLREVLRYGENPHQSAAFYESGERRAGVATARKVQGKELSYNNLNDIDAAYELVAELGSERPAVAIIKHANPCGVAIGASLLDAYAKALACDPVSAFGGVIAFNGTLDAATAAKIAEIFTEAIIAPGADDEALAILARKKNIRVMLAGALPDPAAKGRLFKPLAGGFLVQSRDHGVVAAADLKIVTRRRPTERELADMLFAFRVAKHVKSNAIVYAKDLATVGIGAGQMSRVDSSRIAARKAEDAARAGGLKEPLTRGSAVASDAFFPFADGLLAAAEAGATAIVQPGGSLRDAEVIASADETGLAMAFTGMRHFRH